MNRFYYSKAFLRLLSSNWSAVVKIVECALFPMLYQSIFVCFGNNVDIVVHYDNNPFWISTYTNKDAQFILECA